MKGRQVHDDHVNAEAGASNDTENNWSSREDTTSKTEDIFDKPVEGRRVQSHTNPETYTSNDTENNNENSRIDKSNEGREEHDHSNEEACASNDAENNNKSSVEDSTIKTDDTNNKPVKLSDTNQIETENKEMIDNAKLVELQNQETNSESINDKNGVVSTPTLKRTAPVFGATDSVDSSPSSVTPPSNNVATTETSNDIDLCSEYPYKRPRLVDTAAHQEIPPRRHHDEKVDITEKTIRSDASFETGDIQDDGKSFPPVQRPKSEVAKSFFDAQEELDKVCGDLLTELQPVPLPEKGTHTCNMCEESFFTSWDRRYVHSEADFIFFSC